jgi:hypothetical protein
MFALAESLLSSSKEGVGGIENILFAKSLNSLN